MFLDVIGEFLAFRSGVLKMLHGLCADLASRSHRVKLAALGLTFEGHIKPPVHQTWRRTRGQ